jgi:16S rRNA (uracil1498-N3)-methyltransferase
MQASQRNPSRLYLDDDLQGSEVEISDRTAHYLGHVLRLKQGDRIVVFNGRGSERLAVVKSLARKRPELSLVDQLSPLAEPKLELTLIQALIKADAMDLIVQKAAELGVQSLLTVKTDFSVIKLDQSRAERRLAHWHKIAQSACEQSGRHTPPHIAVADSLSACLAALPDGCLRIAFHPTATRVFTQLVPAAQSVCILIGPEGGFSESDLAAIAAAGFEFVALGPRILRADTAAIAACSMAQLLWGDTGPNAGSN